MGRRFLLSILTSGNDTGEKLVQKNTKTAHNRQPDFTIQLMSFGVGSKLFGTDILSIREIIRNPDINKIEGYPKFIEGFINIRGESIPTIDLASHVGIGSIQSLSDRSKTWALITTIQNRPVGFMVDSVSRIVKISSDMILPAPELILSGLRNNYMRGVCDTEKGLLVVLDFNRLLIEEEIKAIQLHDILK